MNLGLIPTLFFFFGMLSLVYAAAMHFYVRDRDPQVVDHWSLGSLMWGVAVTLTVFRAELPLLISYFLANSIGCIANIELNRALKVLSQQDRGRPVRRWLDVVSFLSYFGALYAIDAHTQGIWRDIAKIGFVSSIMVVLSLLGVRHCFQIARRLNLKLAAHFGSIFVLVAVLWGGRIGIALANQGAHAFDPTPLNTLIFVSIFITGVSKYLIFPMLLLQKTELEKQEQFKKTLTKANRTVTSGALSASIAHELNQPLASIRINGQMLHKALTSQLDDKPKESSDEMKVLIEDILSENERAAKIIMSLRSIFTQGQSNWAQVDSAQLIEKSVGQIKKELEKNQIRLELQLSPNLPITVIEDEFRLVIVNLLFNSLQAMKDQESDKDKVIAIQSMVDSGQVRVSVTDNGPGVPEDMEDALFNILTTSKDTGMGVGLWLSKYIIERHKGTIYHVRSSFGGATFVMSLPLATETLNVQTASDLKNGS